MKEGDNTKFLFRILQGALIGLGAVLPGISGGVLCVIFGVYKPIMELLSDPFHALKKHLKLLIPIVIGIGVGFLGISKILGFLLNQYPDLSVCVFVGLIVGMLPSLFREAGEQGTTKASYVTMIITFIVMLTLLVGLKVISVNIEPGFVWYLFSGFCLALSVIAPGMSFSTLLMPLGLYTPFVEGIGNFDFSVLIPAGFGALLTVILFARAISSLMKHHYSLVFHGIIGIVIAATLVIIPFESFTVSLTGALANLVCLGAGIVAALLLDHFNSKVEKK